MRIGIGTRIGPLSIGTTLYRSKGRKRSRKPAAAPAPRLSKSQRNGTDAATLAAANWTAKAAARLRESGFSDAEICRLLGL